MRMRTPGLLLTRIDSVLETPLAGFSVTGVSVVTMVLDIGDKVIKIEESGLEKS